MSGLDAYLNKLGCAEPTLDRLHAAHLAAIPFENIDVRLGRTPALDLDSLQDKLVARRRGGYCFEQNTLFASMLRALDFEVDTLSARVRPEGDEKPLPRNHMLLRVGDRLADVGFGAHGPLHSVPLDGSISEQPGADYRVRRDGELFILQHRLRDDWIDLYDFTLQVDRPVDFEMANYYTATHPDSAFVRTTTIQLSLGTERHFLRGTSYTHRSDGVDTVRELELDEAVALVGELFRLDVSEPALRGVLSP